MAYLPDVPADQIEVARDEFQVRSYDEQTFVSALDEESQMDNKLMIAMIDDWKKPKADGNIGAQMAECPDDS